MIYDDDQPPRPTAGRRVGYTGRGKRRDAQGRLWIEPSVRSTDTLPAVQDPAQAATEPGVPQPIQDSEDTPPAVQDPAQATSEPGVPQPIRDSTAETLQTQEIPAYGSTWPSRDSGPWAPLSDVVAEVCGRAERATNMGDLERAVLEYQRAAALAPRDLQISDSFARALAISGRRLEAGVELLRLAVLCADMGQRGEALRALEDAERLDPACLTKERVVTLVFRLGPRCLPACGRAVDEHLGSGRLAEARDLLVLMVDAQPNSIDLRYRLARTELMLGHTPRAMKLLRTVFEHYRGEGHVAKWVPIAEDLLRHGGPDKVLLRELGMVYLRSDMPTRALEKLQQLYRLVPSDLGILERVAALQAQLGQGHAATSSLWRLVRAMKRANVDDAQLCELLRRARGWHDSRVHREAIDTLARQALPVHQASRVATPDWALPGGTRAQS